MEIIFENETDAKFDFDEEELADLVGEAVLDHFGMEYEAQVGLTLTDNEGIRVINAEQRDIDAPTDVLSFPMLEYEAAGDFASAYEDDSNFDPDTGALMLGDIVINVDRVKSQALEYGHSEKREYAFLVCHSMLHLCGFDHMEEADEAVMTEKQKIILEGMGITR